MGQVSCVYGVVITEGNILRHTILRHRRKRRIAPARSGGAEPCPEGKPPQGVTPVTHPRVLRAAALSIEGVMGFQGDLGGQLCPPGPLGLRSNNPSLRTLNYRSSLATTDVQIGKSNSVPPGGIPSHRTLHHPSPKNETSGNPFGFPPCFSAIIPRSRCGPGRRDRNTPRQPRRRVH